MNKKSSRIVIIPKGLVDPNNVTIVEIPFEYSKERIVVARYPEEESKENLHPEVNRDEIKKTCSDTIDNSMLNRAYTELSNCKTTSTDKIEIDQNLISDNYEVPNNKCKSVSFYYQKTERAPNVPNVLEKDGKYGKIHSPQRLDVTTIKINRCNPKSSDNQSSCFQNYELNKAFLMPPNMSRASPYPNPSIPNRSYPNPSNPNTFYPNPSYQNPSSPNTSNPNPSYPNPSCLNTFKPTRPYPKPSKPNPSYSNTSNPNPSCPNTFNPTSSYPDPSNLTPSYPTPSNLISSYQISSKPTSSYPTPCNLNPSCANPPSNAKSFNTTPSAMPSLPNTSCKINNEEFIKTISYIEEEEQRNFLAELEKLQNTRRELILKNDLDINTLGIIPTNKIKFKCKDCNY